MRCGLWCVLWGSVAVWWCDGGGVLWCFQCLRCIDLVVVLEVCWRWCGVVLCCVSSCGLVVWWWRWWCSGGVALVMMWWWFRSSDVSMIWRCYCCSGGGSMVLMVWWFLGGDVMWCWWCGGLLEGMLWWGAGDVVIWWWYCNGGGGVVVAVLLLVVVVVVVGWWLCVFALKYPHLRIRNIPKWKGKICRCQPIWNRSDVSLHSWQVECLNRFLVIQAWFTSLDGCIDLFGNK